MFSLFLILILSLFVFYSIRFMLKRDHDLHALAFFSLYIYTIFAQIGYVYFPELSILSGAYYGQTLYYKYWAFMFFSFVFTFLLYRLINRSNSMIDSYIVKKSNRNYGEYFFFLIIILLYISLSMYFEIYRSLFRYGGGNSMGGPWFGILFWIYTVSTLILYTLLRDESNRIKKRILSFVLFLLCFLFFLKVTVASGTRSAILYFFICIAFYELSPVLKTFKFKKRKFFLLALASILVFSSLTSLRTLRAQGETVTFSAFTDYESSDSRFANQDMATTILLQDYYLPSHTLFVSMEYDIVDPIEVIKSNIANSLVLLDYPFLTTTILDRGLGKDNERGVGWAYHFFVEGYNAMGMFGIFYNALFWNLGMALWIALTKSNNRRINQVMVAIIALVLASSMKGQFAAFIKFYWLVLLPGLGLSLLANNSSIAFLRRGRLSQ